MSGASNRKRGGRNSGSGSGRGMGSDTNDPETGDELSASSALPSRSGSMSKKNHLSGSASSIGPESPGCLTNGASKTQSPVFRDLVNLKVLVPSVIAGAIIGKGGETIGELQRESGTRIKMSKSNDFYPGTNERVCLISGNVEGITYILDFIGEKIREKADVLGKDHQDERERQMRLLISNSTAGMIIGKAGAYIRHIKEETGAVIQLSQKSKDGGPTLLNERIVTITGETDKIAKALRMILQKVEEDPQSGNCLNISYSDFQSNANGINSSHDLALETEGTNNGASNGVNSTPTNSVNPNHTNSPFVLPLATGGTLHLKFNMSPSRPPTDLALMSQYLAHISASLRSCGYSDLASEEIGQALRCLANHGIIVMNLSSTATPTRMPQPQPQQPQQQQQPPSIQTPPSIFRGLIPFQEQQQQQQQQPQQQQGFVLSTPAGSYSRYWNSADSPLQDMSGFNGTPRRPVSPARQQHPHFGQLCNNNSFGLGPVTASLAASSPAAMAVPAQHPVEDPGMLEKVDLEVNENIIGAVIGPSGRSILDIQQYSGARIKISKKGTFSPGTRNRIVSISGSPDSILHAKSMIEHKISEEERKRELTAY